MSKSFALQSYTEARNKPRKVGDPLQDDLFQIESEKICTYKKKSDEFIKVLRTKAASELCDGEPDLDPNDLKLYYMYKKIRGDFSIENVLPRGVALDVSLKLDMAKSDTWKQPVLEDIYEVSKMQLLRTEINSTNFEEFDSSVNQFNKRVRVQRNLHFNSPLLAFSVETLKIPKCEFQSMIAARKCRKTDFKFNMKASEVNLMEVPAIFTISDGFNLRIEFKFPWTCKPSDQDQNPGYEVSYDLCDIPNYVLEFWKSLPILFSIDAQDQVNCLLRFLLDLYDIKMDLVVMDLKALAITAGLRMDEMNLLTLCIVCTGSLFPIGLGNFDQRWADDLSDQPKLMQEYIYLKLNYFSYIYRVLMGLILRGCFPDPDICLYGTEMTQSSYIAYFCYFVGDALSTADVSVTRLMGYTRQEMIRELDPNSMNMLFLSEMIIEVPVLQCGGARYLHSVRKTFFYQYCVIKRIKLPQFKEEKPNQNKDLDSEETALMYDRELTDTDPRNGDPVSNFGLQPSPQFKDTIFDVDAFQGNVLEFDPPRDRRIVPALEEWGRLHLKSLPRLFQRLRSVQSNDFRQFWIPRIRVYDKFRLIILRVLDVKDSVEILDNVIQMKRSHVQDHYRRVEEKRVDGYQGRDRSGRVTARVLVNQRQRVDLLNHEINFAGSADRVGVDKNIHDVIPGDHACRNFKWKQRRERRKSRKLGDRNDVVPQRQFNHEKNLRAISNHGIDIDAPLHRPASETRTVRFIDDQSEQPGTSWKNRSGESSRSRHSSGYSSGVESSSSRVHENSRSAGGSVSSRSRNWDSEDNYYQSGFGNYKRPRSGDDLRNTLERNGDLCDTVDRRMSYNKRPRNGYYRHY